jgi:hypothetical protein
MLPPLVPAKWLVLQTDNIYSLMQTSLLIKKPLHCTTNNKNKTMCTMVATHPLRCPHLSNVVRRRSRTPSHHRPLFSLLPNLISNAHQTPTHHRPQHILAYLVSRAPTFSLPLPSRPPAFPVLPASALPSRRASTPAHVLPASALPAGRPFPAHPEACAAAVDRE